MSDRIDIKTPLGWLETDSLSIRMKVVNNLFSQSALPTYYSFPATLADTPRNRLLLGFKNLPESADPIGDKIPVELYFNGNYFDSCLLYINKFEFGSWDVNITSGKVETLKESFEIPLRSLNFKEFNSYDVELLNRYVLIRFDFSSGTAFDFRIKDPDISPAFDVTYNNVMSGTAQDFIDAVIADVNTGTATHSFVASQYKPIQTNAFDYTAWIVLKSDKTWNKNSLELISTNVDLFAEHTNLQLVPTTIPNWDYYNPLCAHMNAITDPEFYVLYQQWFGIFDYRFPVIYNNILNANETVPPLPILNWWHFENRRFEPLYYEMDNYFKYNFDAKVACVKVRRVLEAIGDTIGFVFETDLFDDPEMEELLLMSNGIFHYLTNTDIDLRLSMPDTTIGEFLTDFKNLFGLWFFYDFSTKRIIIRKSVDLLNKTQYQEYSRKRVSDIKREATVSKAVASLQFNFDSADTFAAEEAKPTVNGLKGSVSTTASLPSSGFVTGDMYYVQDDASFYIATLNPTTSIITWNRYAQFLSNYKVQDTGSVIDIGITPTMLKYDLTQAEYAYTGLPTFNIVLPVINQPSKIKGQTAEQNPFKARIAFYRGLQKLGSSTLEYPFATFDNLDFDQNILGDLCLRFETVGAFSLIELFYEDLINFLNTCTPFYTNVKQDGNDIANWDTSLPLKFESLMYFIDTIDFVINNKTETISSSKLTMYKK